jgi:hypothetical protein
VPFLSRPIRSKVARNKDKAHSSARTQDWGLDESLAERAEVSQERCTAPERPHCSLCVWGMYVYAKRHGHL